MSKSKGELLRNACVFAEMQVRSSELPLDMAIWNKAAEFYDKGTATDLPVDVLEYVAEVEARANAATPGPWTDDNGYRVRREDGEVVAETKHCEGSNSYDSTFIASARADVPTLIAIARDQAERLAKLESLGPWIEVNRLAELDRANTWIGRPTDEAYVRGREDALKQVGYELNNRQGPAKGTNK